MLERATRFWSLAAHQRGTLRTFSKEGTKAISWSSGNYEGLVAAGLLELVEDTTATYTLTDEGAHVMFHAADTERGIMTSLYGDWRTKAEARAAGDLPREQETTVKVFRDGAVVIWEHPADCAVSV